MGMHSGQGDLITSFADKVSLRRLERFQRLANVLDYLAGYSLEEEVGAISS